MKETTDLVAITEEILNVKLHFLCSEIFAIFRIAKEKFTNLFMSFTQQIMARTTKNYNRRQFIPIAFINILFPIDWKSKNLLLVLYCQWFT